MESWFLISIFGYLLLSLEAVFSKALLSSKVKDWRLYLFYVGLFSLSGLIFAPFGLKWFGVWFFMQSFLAGIIFYLALAFLYKSLQKSSASRVFVLYGVVITLISFGWEHFYGTERFSRWSFLGILFLTLGGFLISLKIYERRLFSSYKNVIISGVLMGIALIVLKASFDNQNFVTGYVFSRIGIFCGAMVLFLIPDFRRIIKFSFSRKEKKNSQKSLVWVVGNKAIAGLGTILVSYSMSLGSVALVTALVSVQYLFTFVFATVGSYFVVDIIREKITWKNVLFKLFGVILIILGIFLIN